MLNTTPLKMHPIVTITSQVLADDTGASASDGITSNGTVSLTGLVSGEAGDSVSIYDGGTLLGTATLSGLGGWSFATVLSAGPHDLVAVLVNPQGHKIATSAFAPQVLVENASPLITIRSQKLAHDTGVSGNDLITNNGTVTVTGTVSGAVGTIVQIFDGTSLLGQAAPDRTGNWTYTTSLPSGVNAIHAVATDPAGNASATPVQPAITVDHKNPVVSYTYESQIQGSNSVQLFGNYTGPAGTKIEIFSGKTDLGTATITGPDSWSFATPQLANGNYSFTAVATTVAGNSATFGGIPSLTVGSTTGTLNHARFSTVWDQNFTTSQIDRSIFPIVYGNQDQFSYGPNGLTLTSYRSEGFSNVGILQANWGKGLSEGYGLYSVTASHPAEQGTGVAILLWPSNNVWPGPEIDMVEDWNDPTGQTAYFSVHFKSPLDGSDMVDTIQYSVDLTKSNTFSLDWERGSLTYYVNDHELFHLTGSEVPKDFADGGINSAFGAQISDIGKNYEPSDQVSLTISDMSYSVLGAAPAAIHVSGPGNILHTASGSQQVVETITGVNLGTSTVYVLVMNSANVSYGPWQAVTLDSLGVGTFYAMFHGTGDYIAVTTDPTHQTINGSSAAVTLGAALDVGGVLTEAVSHNDLWFEHSGNDLVVDVLGTTQRTFIDNWYGNGQPGQQVVSADGLKLDTGINSLVHAMASFESRNPGFNVATTTHTTLADPFFSESLIAAVTGAWHH